RKPMMSTPDSVAGVDYYQRIMARYNKPELLITNSHDAATAFAMGETAVTMQAPDLVANYRADADHPGLRAGWSTAPMPAGPKGRFTFFGGSDLSIWKRTAHPAAAYEWV